MKIHNEEFENTINERNQLKEQLEELARNDSLPIRQIQEKDLTKEDSKLHSMQNYEFDISKDEELELYEYCDFIKKAMGELPSFTTSSLMKTFGTSDGFSQATSSKDYSLLLIQLLKVISIMLAAEYADFKNPPDLNYEELKPVSPHIKDRYDYLRNSIEEYIYPDIQSQFRENAHKHIYICSSGDD